MWPVLRLLDTNCEGISSKQRHLDWATLGCLAMPVVTQWASSVRSGRPESTLEEDLEFYTGVLTRAHHALGRDEIRGNWFLAQNMHPGHLSCHHGVLVSGMRPIHRHQVHSVAQDLLGAAVCGRNTELLCRRNLCEPSVSIGPCYEAETRELFGTDAPVCPDGRKFAVHTPTGYDGDVADQGAAFAASRLCCTPWMTGPTERCGPSAH